MLTHSNCAFCPSWLYSPDIARFVYRLHCSTLSVEISTLAYEANSCCWPESLSMAYCNHI